MRTILILFVIASAKCDKLDKLYLPPIGANYSGGSFENTVPFQVPGERYTVNKVDPENKFIPGYDPKKNFGGSGPSIYTSTDIPSTTSKLLSIVPFSDRPNYDQATQGLSSQPSISDAYNPTQYSDYYNSKNSGPSTSSIQNLFQDSNLADGTPLSLLTNPTVAKYEGRNPINAEKNSIPEKINYMIYSQRVIRPQAEADRNAVILNYDNVITPEGFAYSYDTSNGIHADENGTAIDGVKADGSYSYIGDDGKLYNISYSADENGFRPRGDHLPTSPPIPDAILKVIEQAARDKSNGIFDDGSYDEKKYGYQKYQTPQERFLSINKPTPTRKYNNGSAKQSENSNINNVRDGNLNSRDKNYFTKSTTNPLFYKSDGNTITNPLRPIVNGQEDIYNDNKSQTANVIQEPNEDFRQGTSEPKKAYDRQSHKNHESNTADLSNGQILQNELGYKYPSPKDKFQSSNFNNNKGSLKNDYNEIIQNSDINPKSSNQNKIPLIENESVNPQSYNVNRFIGPERGYPYRNRDYQFGQRIPSDTSTRVSYDYYSTLTTSRPVSISQRVNTSDEYSKRNNQFPTNDNQKEQQISRSNYPSNDQTVKQFDIHNVRPNKFYIPSSTDRIKQIDTYTSQPNDFYGPSSTERIKQNDTYTSRPNDLYGPSSTERIKQTDTYTGRPNDFYGPSSTERTNKIDTTTGRPNVYYGPSSTERIKQIDTYTGRPNDLYGPSSTERIKQTDTYTGRPNDFYGPSSTERTNKIDTTTGRPNVYYGPSSTERIKQIDTYTGRPSDLISPSSTERIKQIDTFTGRPNDFYGPTSTERIKQIDTYTGRPRDFYGPSSTEKNNEIGTFYVGKPSDYYGPFSTERLKQFDTYTDRPNGPLSPSSTAGIKQTITYIDTPNDFYSPSSTERIKQIGDHNGLQVNQIGTYGSKPSDYNGPLSTERIKQFGTYTDGPNEKYGPSTTNGRDRIGAYAEQPNDYYGPSSTEKIKQFDTFTDRLNNYYNPSSTERIKQIGTTDGPQIFKGDSSTVDKIIGENFPGPKQPQSYNPETGYHY